MAWSIANKLVTVENNTLNWDGTFIDKSSTFVGYPDPSKPLIKGPIYCYDLSDPVCYHAMEVSLMNGDGYGRTGYSGKAERDLTKTGATGFYAKFTYNAAYVLGGGSNPGDGV